MILTIIIALAILALGLSAGIRTVDPNERGLIVRLGKYNRYAQSGFHYIVPIIESMIRVNLQEMMVDVDQQEIITADSLNAMVDAQIYFKIKDDEKSVYNSQFNASNYERLIVNLARTTLRAIIGDMTLNDANSKRSTINENLKGILTNEAKNWGIEIVRAELRQIDPPEKVQEVMNDVVVAEKKKKAAIDFATAAETEADGKKRAEIKLAEAEKQKLILEAQGRAEALTTEAKAKAEQIQLVNEAAKKYFIEGAVELKKLEVMQASMEKNSKIIIAKDGINPQLIIGNLPTESGPA